MGPFRRKQEMTDFTLTCLAQSEGNKLDIRVYRKGRKCKICKTPLSIYTPGPCCHADSDYWAKRERKLEEYRQAKLLDGRIKRMKLIGTVAYNAKHGRSTSSQ